MKQLTCVLQLVKAQIMENDIPVFVIAFHTQEMHAFRDPKTGSVVVGADDRIKQCSYVVVMTRLEEELDNEETGGWKIIDVRLHALSLRFTDTKIYTDGKKGICLNDTEMQHEKFTTAHSGSSPLTTLFCETLS